MDLGLHVGDWMQTASYPTAVVRVTMIQENIAIVVKAPGE
jgi:hypothetical protein